MASSTKVADDRTLPLAHPLAALGNGAIDMLGGPARARLVLVFACVLGLSAADAATVGAIAAPLEHAMHISNAALGLLVTLSTGVGAIATLPAGALVDRVNRTRLLAAAVLTWSAVMIVSGAAASYPMLLISRVGLGAVVALAGPAVASLTGDWFPASDRTRIWGYILTGELVGAGIGFVVCGDLAAAVSWRWSFWVLAAPGALLAYALFRVPEPRRGGISRLPEGAEEIDPAPSGPAADEVADEADGREVSLIEREITEEGVPPRRDLVLTRDPKHRSLWWATRYILSIPTNRTLIIASGLGYFFLAGLKTFGVLFLRDRFGLGQTTANLALVLIGAGAIVGAVAAGRYADRLLARHHISARPVVGGVALLVAAVAFLPGLSVSSFAVAAIVLCVGAAGLGGSNPPLDAARLDLVHPALWGRGEAVRTVLRSALEAGAPLVFGYLSGLLGTGTSQFAAAGGSDGRGLELTFLLMLAPLVLAGVLLLTSGARGYPRDVATAIASQEPPRP